MEALYQTITDRIALKRKINDNLEATAGALFNEYFFNENADFATEPLDCNISFVNGLAIQNFRPDDGEPFLPVIKIRELNMGYCDGGSEFCTKDIDQSRIIECGDLVFSWSGSLTIDYWHDGTAGLNQHLFKVTSDKYPLWFSYLWVKYHLRNFQRIAENKGTTFGHIKREDLSNAEILLPTSEQFTSLDNKFSPIFRRKLSNGIEALELAKLQDLLLSNLSSGQ